MWQLPKCAIPKLRLPKGQVRPSEEPQAAMGAECCGQDGLGGRALRLKQAGRALRLGKTWDQSCRLGNFIVGKLPFGKYPWEVAAFPTFPYLSVPNIYSTVYVKVPMINIIDGKFSLFKQTSFDSLYSTTWLNWIRNLISE